MQWPKDTTKFTVSVTKNVKCRTSYSYIPKSVLDLLDTPRYLTFKIKDGQVTVTQGQK